MRIRLTAILVVTGAVLTVAQAPLTKFDIASVKASAIGDDVGMTCIETPSAALSLPDIGEAASRQLASYKSDAWGTRGCHDRLKAHDEYNASMSSGIVFT